MVDWRARKKVAPSSSFEGHFFSWWASPVNDYTSFWHLARCCSRGESLAEVLSNIGSQDQPLLQKCWLYSFQLEPIRGSYNHHTGCKKQSKVLLWPGETFWQKLCSIGPKEESVARSLFVCLFCGRSGALYEPLAELRHYLGMNQRASSVPKIGRAHVWTPVTL